MPNYSNLYLSQALEYWQRNQPLEAGRLIFENLPLNVRPQWAANVLRAVVNYTGVRCVPIDEILRCANLQTEWKKAHEAFSNARRLTLELNRIPIRSSEQTLLLKMLGLAEIVAKVIYNATDPTDEFDEDSGWWIAPCLKSILESLNDDSFASSAWLLLSFQDTAGANAS